MFAIRDKLGKTHREPVWVIASPEEENISAHYKEFNRKIKLILMPAFNPLIGSTINISAERHLGPVLNKKLFKLNSALLMRLDGTRLGKLEDMS
jgi:metallophosphoesterase superfamily enzyme